VSDRVNKQEVQAILDAVDGGADAAPPADVQPRNFRQPRRLSRERLQYLAQLVNATMQGVCSDIAAPLRQHHKISLASISEVNVLGLFDDYEPPFLVNIFECGGHVSWVLWDSAAAAATVETILSGPPPQPEEEEHQEEDEEADDGEQAHEAEPLDSPAYEARRLSDSECRVVESLIAKILAPVAGAFGLEVSGGRLAQEPEEMTTLEDCGPGADARRLMLHFLFEGPGSPSDLRIYLPDVGEEDRADGDSQHAGETPLPEHLDSVHLDVAAYLASVDVPLQDLMSLEVGDVIPLGVEAGAPIDLYIEDRCCARGTWGRVHNQQAVRIVELDTHSGEIEDPTDWRP
jgi:flagellar motor switch protein FliM